MHALAREGVAFVIVAYAVSPIDLIPDFIPVLGLIDDMILLPLLIIVGLWLAAAVAVARWVEWI